MIQRERSKRNLSTVRGRINISSNAAHYFGDNEGSKAPI